MGIEMELDLFSFSFDPEHSADQLDAALKEVIAQAKRSGNHHSFHVFHQYEGVSLSGNTINCLPELQEKGYLELWNSGTSRMCQLNDELKDWHDPREVAALFRTRAMDVLQRGGTYYDLYGIFIFINGPGIDEAIDAVREEIALDLGIEHARKKPKALGIMPDLSRKRNPALIHEVYNATRDLNDWRAVKAYFETVAFEEYSKNVGFRIARLIPSMYEAVCLAQAETVEDIKFIVPYLGSCWDPKDLEGVRIIRMEDGAIEAAAQEEKEPDEELDDEDWGEEEDEYLEDDIDYEGE